MTVDTTTFENLRNSAAKQFAQTMIIIDDEASQGSESPTPQSVVTLRRPDRSTRSTKVITDGPTRHAEGGGSGSHMLDAKSLIDNAMELGLICSVLRPKKGENFRSRVVKAAQVADIVCLDWEIYNDGGDAASKIIGDIVREDTKQNGRLRLIAIYTGDITNDEILDKIFSAIPDKQRDQHEFKKESLKIESKNGVKIVCLFKVHGIQLLAPRSANQVDESQLPKRLQTEFAKLSEGLLSNVALATIASIRNSTHHILSKFTSQMDAPFFHHRALIENPEDAEEYAVDIVLSELMGSVDKQRISDTYAGHQAIEARIREIAGDAATLTLQYGGNGSPSTYDLEVDVSIRMIKDGLRSALDSEKLVNIPKKQVFEENLSTLFSDNQQAARCNMHQFAAFTSVRAYPGSHLYSSNQLLPRLGLGTIIQGGDKTYLMCLQASCDSVRIKGSESFLFVPLEKEDNKPEYVVPISPQAANLNYIGLSISNESYRIVRSIAFSACPKTETVNAKKIRSRQGFYFEDTNGETHRWIADLKHQRALRTVQRLGQRMGRIGFDEFEPYRQK